MLPILKRVFFTSGWRSFLSVCFLPLLGLYFAGLLVWGLLQERRPPVAEQQSRAAQNRVIEVQRHVETEDEWVSKSQGKLIEIAQKICVERRAQLLPCDEAPVFA